VADRVTDRLSLLQATVGVGEVMTGLVVTGDGFTGAMGYGYGKGVGVTRQGYGGGTGQGSQGHVRISGGLQGSAEVTGCFHVCYSTFDFP
jgi:hypothetical protein